MVRCIRLGPWPALWLSRDPYLARRRCLACSSLLYRTFLLLMANHVQDAEVKMNRVLEASQQTHWAAFLLDSSLSRTRRMKGLILQLLCEH